MFSIISWLRHNNSEEESLLSKNTAYILIQKRDCHEHIVRVLGQRTEQSSQCHTL